MKTEPDSVVKPQYCGYTEAETKTNTDRNG